jgi:hypothetical protein
MFIRNGKEIIELYRGKTPILEMYYGKYLVYQAIRSCFGNGYWISDKPWINSDVWRNK